jgi:hypothetical protein
LAIENLSLFLANVPFAEYVFTCGFFYLGHVAVEPDGHRHAAVAKALLDRLGKVTQCSAVAPLRQVDIFAGPDVKHISVVVELLLDMVLKCNHFAVTFEFEVDFFVRYIAISSAIMAITTSNSISVKPLPLRMTDPLVFLQKALL